jgi:hypothetical protein
MLSLISYRMISTCSSKPIFEQPTNYASCGHQHRPRLRKLNIELVASDPENTAILERQLLEVDETVPDLQEGERHEVDTLDGLPSWGSLVVDRPQKRLLDEIVVQPLPAKRVQHTRATRR